MSPTSSDARRAGRPDARGRRLHRDHFEYPDETALLKGNNSNGPVVLAERTSGEVAVGDAIRDALALFRTSSGAYRIETEWRYVTARV